jgi:flavin-dependent dehydrogenase
MTVAATTSMAEAVGRTWDAVVVGAGPAGAMAAHELARRGCGVLLVDRAAFPRWKVCGCCLNGHALATLRAAGLGELTARGGAVPLESIRLAAAGYRACVPLSGGVSLSRETFDAALVSAAIQAGAAFLPRTHASLPNAGARSPDRAPPQRIVELRQGQTIKRIAARVALAADGLGGNLMSRAGVGEVAIEPGGRIGVGVVAADAPAFYSPGVIFMACGRSGYLGLVRLEDGRLDLAAAFDARWVRVCGGPGRAAVELLSEAGWPAVPGLLELSWRGTPALTRRARHLAAERLFLLGDAAGYIEPFTGEGMAWALAAGRAVAPLAARAASGWRPELAQAWSAIYHRLIARRQMLCRAISVVLRSPPLTRAMIYLLSRAPVLAAPVTRYLGD